jgi:UDP-glucose:(heptosyl)LPS alpha-1,3-glucosyltransferase
VDAVVGFNKMPGLDIYYCADPCFEHKSRHLRPWWYRLTPRYRHFSHYERAIFTPGEPVEILMISPVQQALFERYYGTEPSRMTMLPPGISRDRRAPANAAEVRAEFRRELGLSDDQLLLLQIGSGFRTKGLDRSLEGMASLPESLRKRTRLFVIGQDDAAGFRSQAEGLGIAEQVQFFFGRDDVPRFLQGADLLIHPAYAENTGTVLLEAVVAGLPVLVTDVCGYAHYVAEAGAGKVLASPFDREAFSRELMSMLLADRSKWRNNGLQFADTADIYDMPARAADVIDRVLERKRETVSG